MVNQYEMQGRSLKRIELTSGLSIFRMLAYLSCLSSHQFRHQVSTGLLIKAGIHLERTLELRERIVFEG